LRSIPKWANESKIREIYEQCSEINRVSSEKHVVDHIIPLQGKNVCGLHVDYNLRIITAQENATKANKLLEEFAC
jgi:5-methylcytosine-specific restriction endonuclease McrA